MKPSPPPLQHRLLKTYASLDGGRLRALVACVKHWAKRRAVNDPYRCVAFFLLVLSLER